MTQSIQNGKNGSSNSQHDKLCHFIRATMKAVSMNQQNRQTYKTLILELDCFTRYKPESIRKWYLALTECVDCLNLHKNRDLRKVIFSRFRWDFPFETLNAYCQFCCNLVSKDATAVSMVLDSCIRQFTQLKNTKDKVQPETKDNRVNDDVSFSMIHQLLQRLHSQRPRLSTKTIQIASDNFPKIHQIKNDSVCVETFVTQLFTLMAYVPELKVALLQLIIERMIEIDTMANKIDLENLEKIENEEETKISSQSVLMTNTGIDTRTGITTNTNEEITRKGENDANDTRMSSDDERDEDDDSDDSDDENEDNESDDSMNSDENESDNENETILNETIGNQDMKMSEEKQNDSDIDKQKIILEKLKKENAAAYAMDRLMVIIFEYIKTVINSNDNKLIKELFVAFCRIFERSILSTVRCNHIQFIMFYFCQFRVTFAEEFMKQLLTVCTNLQSPQHERCLAAAYVGGFVSKARYCRQASSLTTFEILLQWAVSYLEVYNRTYPFSHSIGINESKKHPLFFSVCQALFRIYTHRQNVIEKKWASDKQAIENIYKLVKSPLQPLKHCEGNLTRQFLISVKLSQCINYSLFPKSTNEGRIQKSLLDLHICPFDDYTLPLSLEYLEDLFHSTNGKEDSDNNDDNEEKTSDITDKIELWANQINPEMALTPTVSAVSDESPMVNEFHNHVNHDRQPFSLDGKNDENEENDNSDEDDEDDGNENDSDDSNDSNDSDEDEDDDDDDDDADLDL